MAADKIGGKVVPATGAWQKSFDYNFLGHWDVPENGSMDVTIDRIEERLGAKVAGKTQDVTLIFFKEEKLTEGKPMILNKANSKILNLLFRTKNMEKWVGHKVTLYSDFVKSPIYTGEALRFKDKLPTGSAPVQKQELDVSSPNFEQIKDWLVKAENKLSSVVGKYEVTPAALEVLKTIKQE